MSACGIEFEFGPAPLPENAKNAKQFSFDGVETTALVTKTYDAGSVTLTVTLFGTPVVLKTRLLHVDTPELRTQDLLEKALGYRAKEFVQDLILGKVVTVKFRENDLYGRPLCDITLADGKDLATLLIERRLAIAYEGGKKQKWDDFIQEHHPNLQPYAK